MRELDDDILHYIKIAAIIIISSVVILGFLFFLFRPSAKIELSTHSIEYGENVSAIDLIKTVKNENIATAEKNRGTMTFENLEISATELNTNKLGKQTIIYSFSDGSEDISETVEIVDTIKPKIILKKKKVVLTLEEAKKTKSWDKYYEVKDNYNEFPTVLEELEKKDLNYGITTYIKVRAVDSSGNEAEEKIQLQIKEKEVKKTEKKEMEEKDVNVQKPQTPAQPVPEEEVTNEPLNPSDEKSEEPVQIPAKDYLFSDGYDMTTAPQACQIDLGNSGRSGMCIPIQDSNGIYIGMRLTFQ